MSNAPAKIKNKKIGSPKLYGLLLVAIWSMAIILGTAYHLYEDYSRKLDQARIMAIEAFKKDVVYRYWAAGHGGVYVPVTENTPPNPYLSHLEDRDLTSSTGVKLTLVNPAYMTRQVHELGEELYGLHGHITSLKPIRPENAPDDWERAALQQFHDEGKNEVSETVTIEGERFLRVMHPLTTDKKCLKCHAAQGYKEGELRGGISVSVNIEPYLAIFHQHKRNVILSAIFMFLAGVGGIAFSFSSLQKSTEEKNRAVEALSESNLIVTRSPAVAFLWKNEEDWPVAFVTDNVAQLLGYTPADFMAGRVSYAALIHEDDMERVGREVISNSHDATVEQFQHEPYRVIARDGSIKWIDDITHIRRDERGKITHYEGIVLDVTDRQKAIEKIRQQAKIVEDSLNEIYIFDDVSLHFLKVNRGARLNLGYSLEELLAMTPVDIKPDFTLSSFSALLHPLRSGSEKLVTFSTTHRRKDGSTYPVEVHLQYMTDARPVFMAIILDISEQRKQEEIRHQAEEERNEALREFTDLYNDAPDMYISVDAGNGKVVKCNQAVLDKLGYGKEEIMALSIFDLYHPDCREEVKSEIFPAFQKTGMMRNIELLVQRKDGSPLPVTLDASAVYDNEGNILQSRLIWHDISERKKLEEQLLISEKMTTIAGLAAGVAHEINTPLSAILQSAQLIEMGLDPDQETNRDLAEKLHVDLECVQDYLHSKELDFFLSGIRDSAANAGTIVEDLLQFSRPGERTATWAKLSELIDRSIELAKTDYHLKKKFHVLDVDFVRDYSPDLLEIMCMAMEIEQVLINLIKNSCHAMEYGGGKEPRIIIRTRKQEQTAVIEIEDNGPGIKEEHLQNIFDPFFTTKGIGEGTGLGLAVCYSIICDKHGGTMRMESSPGKKNVVVITLPITIQPNGLT
ncbi:MAG: PAS domain S-box protein [Thermodesulfobacteriota bacterium]